MVLSSAVMKLKSSVCAILLLVSGYTHAMTYDEASENLMYFGYLRLATAQCESKGFTNARTIYKAWMKQYGRVAQQSHAVIRAEHNRRKLPAFVQNQIMQQVNEQIHAMSQNMLKENPAPCKNYRAFIDGVGNVKGYHTFLKK